MSARPCRRLRANSEYGEAIGRGTAPTDPRGHYGRPGTIPTKQIFKAHGVTEFSLADYTIHDVNITTVKAWARRVTGSPGKRNDKDMIAEALRIYFDDPEMKLNKEGDEADAIAVGIVYLTQTKRIKAAA